MRTVLADLRYGWRILWKSWGYAASVILILALGIACTTAMFTVVNVTLLRRLPVPRPDRIVRVGAVYPAGVDPVDLWGRNRTLEALAYFNSGGVNLRTRDATDRLYAVEASAAFFSVLEVQPAMGRGFTVEEARSGDHRLAVLSHRLWLSRFNGSASVLGRAIDLNGVPYTVIGIMPERFAFPGHAELWILKPHGVVTGLDLGSDVPADVPDHLASITMIGRLRDGVSVAQASAEHKALFVRIEREREGPRMGTPQGVSSLQGREPRAALLILFGAAIFVLLIACANAANLTLARSTVRQREMAIRICLGASRWHVVRQLLAESLIVAIAGGISGVVLTFWCLKIIRMIAPANIPRISELAVDGPVCLFAVVVSLFTAILVGLAPAREIFHTDPARAMKAHQSGFSAGRRGRFLRDVLAVAEVALAIVLVSGAGLLIKSLSRLTGLETGIDTQGVVTADLGIPRIGYEEKRQAAVLQQRLLEEVKRIPGVIAVGLTHRLPYGGKRSGGLYISEADQVFRGNWVSGDYFRAIGIPIMSGRAFTFADTQGSPVVIVNQALARRLWGDGNAIGRQIRINDLREVIGVAGDIRAQPYKTSTLEAAPEPEFYLPGEIGAATLVVRTAADLGSTASSLRMALKRVDPAISVFHVRTMEQVLEQFTAPSRFRAWLLASFAFLAFALATMGVAGLVSYVTARRTSEIGLRKSLGADAGDIVRLVLGQGFLLALIGVVIGTALSLGLSRVMAGLLFEVRATDPLAHFASAILLGTAVLAGSAIPAWRASRIEPVDALRTE